MTSLVVHDVESGEAYFEEAVVNTNAWKADIVVSLEQILSQKKNPYATLLSIILELDVKHLLEGD